MAILLYVESVEDNEAIFVENARQFTRIIGPDSKSILEILEKPKEVLKSELYFQINSINQNTIFSIGFVSTNGCRKLHSISG